jgi:putative oxidoreductase
MEFFQNLSVFVGRLCIGSLYVWAAIAKLANWKGTVTYMKSKQLPLTFLLLPMAVLMQLSGGALIALGYYTRIGALILICFTIPAAIKMHNFWNVSGEMRTIEKTLFMKDVAIVGALLILLAFGPGHFSFDGS